MSTSTSTRFVSVLKRLVAGALVNLGVAWACILWMPPSVTVTPHEPPDGGYPADIVGPSGIAAWWRLTYGPGWMSAVPMSAGGADGEFLYWRGTGTPAFYRAGWPVYSVQSVVSVARADGGTELHRWELPWSEIVRRGVQTNGLPPQLRARPGRRVPVVPIGWAFCLNTIAYALVLVGTGRLWRAGRRWRLSRRPDPTCLGCGYNLTGLGASSACPECGRPIPAPPNPAVGDPGA